ncbi:MAG: hypothetical protein JNJ78_19605 [Anaerolineae bacterium]|nr:hypothetical protein [Anaerolineae bacterium]
MLSQAYFRRWMEGVGGGGGGAAVKGGGNALMLPPKGAFVVVVVVADKKYGGNERDWRRQGFSPLDGMRLLRCAASC